MKRKDAKKILAFSLAGAIALGGMYIPSANVQAADATLTDGLTAWYDFDGGSLNMESKTVTNQATGDGRLADGTLASNGASVSISEGAGISGSGLHFTQETISWFQVENAINTSEAYTVSLWVNIEEDNSPNDQRSIVQQTGSGRTVLLVRNAKLGGYTSAKDTTVPNTTVPFDEWVHLVVSGSSHTANATTNKYRIWMNGVKLVDDDLLYSNMTKAITPLRFGCHKNNTQAMKGYMDSIRVYNKEADQALVDALYEEHTAKKYTVTAKDYTGGKVTCEGNDFTLGRFTYGDTVKLTAEANNGYDFSYWYDADTKKVLSNTADLDLIVLNTRNVTPVFTEQGSAEFTVTFKLPDLFSNKRISTTQAVNNMVTAPNSVDVYGYQFVNWKNVADENDTHEANEEFEVKSNATYEAVLNTLGNVWIFVIENGQYTDSKQYELDKVMNLSPTLLPEGKVCVGWEMSFDNQNFFPVSSNPNYSFVTKKVSDTTGNMIILRAKYADAANESTEPTVALGISSRTKAADGQKDNLRLQVLYDGVAGTTVVEKGILLTWDDNSKEKLNIEDADSSVKRFYSNGTAQTGSYILNATLGVNTSANSTVHYVGYVTYKDSTGALNTIYTAPVSLPPIATN